MFNKTRVPVIDLFSGAGGLSKGLLDSGFEIVAAVEIDKIASETYRRNIGNVVLNADICTINGKELLALSGVKDGEMFVLAGCPPCQGFSSIGLRNFDDIRNQLAFQFVRLVNETNPWFIIMENVPGMSKGIGKELFKEICDMLQNSYDISYDILNSADYGVPQQRKRLVLHGISKKVKKSFFPDDFEIDMPKRTHKNSDFDSCDELKEWETVKVIEDLPKIEAGQSSNQVANHVCRNLSELNIKRIKNTPHNGGSRCDWDDELVLDCHRQEVGYTDVYGRMDYSKVAPTITAGCLSYSKGRFGHPTQDRPISAREAARLQTFPDDYIFEGNLDQIGRQIGNAVPPKLAEASGKHLFRYIEKYILNKCIK